MDSMVINQNALHLEVGLLTSFLILELNESILKTIACAFVADDFTRYDFPEAAEDQIQVLVYDNVSQARDGNCRRTWLTFCYWVQLAYKKHVLRGLNLCIW